MKIAINNLVTKKKSRQEAKGNGNKHSGTQTHKHAHLICASSMSLMNVINE